MKKKPRLTTGIRAVVLIAVMLVSALAAAPRGGKTKAQCRAELNQCMYSVCKNKGSQDAACVDRCSKTAQSCMMGAKPDSRR